MKNVFLSIIAVFVLAPGISVAVQGPGDAGGGDACERRIQEIRDDISKWIAEGGPSGFENIPVSVETYSNRMNTYLATTKLPDGSIKPVTKIECVNRPPKVDKFQKQCEFDKSGPEPMIQCFIEAFTGTNPITDDEQYRTIHHEYAGLAGLEVPFGSQSTYLYSNQLVSDLENQVVKRLVVRKRTSSTTVKSEYCISKWDTGTGGPHGSWRTTCSYHPKMFSTWAKGDRTAGKALLDEKLKQVDLVDTGSSYFYNKFVVYSQEPSAEYCVLAESAGRSRLPNNVPDVHVLDCGDGALLRLPKESVQKYLAKNGLKLVYVDAEIKWVWTGDHMTAAQLSVFKRPSR